MSSNYKILSKGLYRGVVDKTFPVEVKEYVFTRQNDAKFLILRFFNESKVNFTAIHFWLIQKDSYGQQIAKEKIVLDGIYCGAGSTFSPSTCFLVQDNCVDFELKMISAFSGEYEYKSENGEGFVRYADPLDRNYSVKRRHYCVQRRKLNKKVKFLGLIFALAIFLILLAIAWPFFIDVICPLIFNAIVALVKLIIILCKYIFHFIQNVFEFLFELFEEMSKSTDIGE